MKKFLKMFLPPILIKMYHFLKHGNIQNHDGNIQNKDWTKICLSTIKHGYGCRVNFESSFSENMEIGNDCHFNGITAYGKGIIKIGNHFHSGKNFQIITHIHNYDHGSKLPYDDTYLYKDVEIEDKVWIGQDVTVIGGVKIGEGAIIQAGSVVCIDVPPWLLLVGILLNRLNIEIKVSMKNYERFNCRTIY